MATKLVKINPNLKLGNLFGDLHEWRVTFFDDKKGVMYQRVTDCLAIRQLVDELGEHMYCRPVRTIADEVQKEIIKWVKEGEQKPFVYVLLTESSYDYESSQNVRCFKSLKVAQKEMKEAYKAELADWKSSYEKDFIENGITNTTAYINEDGDFTRNHITWEIYAEEIN